MITTCTLVMLLVLVLPDNITCLQQHHRQLVTRQRPGRSQLVPAATYTLLNTKGGQRASSRLRQQQQVSIEPSSTTDAEDTVSLEFDDSFIETDEESDQNEGDDDDDGSSSQTPNFQRDQLWLETSTSNFLEAGNNHNKNNDDPLLFLSMDEVNQVKGLMSAWAKRGSPLMVERLLKRIIDDMRAGNHGISVSTRFYAIVSSQSAGY